MVVALSLFALSVLISSVRDLFADGVLVDALGCGCAAWWVVGGLAEACVVAAVTVAACAAADCAAASCVAAACAAAAVALARI